MTNEPRRWKKRQTKMIDVASIKIGDRILKPTKARVAAMKRSLSSDLGQLTPILITKYLTAWRVVAGATRLMAANELDWDQIEATIIGADNEYEYQLIEIAENFDRHDLTEAERKRLKELDRELRAARLVHFEKLAAGEDTPPILKTKGGRGKKGGVADAARKAGVPLTTAQRRMQKPTQNEKRVGLADPAPKGSASPPKPEREPATSPPLPPQQPPQPQPQASPEPAASKLQVRCPYCGQGMVTPEEAERIPVGPQVDATATRH